MFVEKKCPCCSEVKPAVDFNKDNRSKSGLQAFCRVCQQAKKKACYQKHLQKQKEKSLAWKKQNKEKTKIHNLTWVSKNKEKVNKKNARWRKQNKDKVNALTAKRRAQYFKATPSWVNFEDMQSFYTAAKAFQLYTGKEYHVDHIVPLNSKQVCGLHVPWNLQVLEAFANISKSNKHWPDMP